MRADRCDRELQTVSFGAVLVRLIASVLLVAFLPACSYGDDDSDDAAPATTTTRE